MSRGEGATVLVAGLGDLGGRTLELLAGNPRVGHLVGCGTPSSRSTSLVAQTGLIADSLDGAAHVAHQPLDLSDRDAVATYLRRAAPDVVVFAASRHSWWRTPPSARALPYGVWLPLQVSLLRTFMAARRDAGVDSVVVALPHPDIAGPLLAVEGLAPHTGAGNVAEVAAKLRLLVAAERGCRRADVEVRLVLHHAAERLAFAVFDHVGPRPLTVPSAATRPLPPYLAQVRVHGEPVPPDEVDRLLHQAYPLPTGTGSHQLTAATTARLVDALLGEEPRALHVPAPGGLPGGYPVRVAGGTVELDLPADLDLADAVAVNEQAATFDGIASIGTDGTLHYSEEAVTAAHEVLGITLRDTPLAGLERAAEQLDQVLRRVGGAGTEVPGRGDD